MSPSSSLVLKSVLVSIGYTIVAGSPNCSLSAPSTGIFSQDQKISIIVEDIDLSGSSEAEKREYVGAVFFVVVPRIVFRGVWKVSS